MEAAVSSNIMDKTVLFPVFSACSSWRGNGTNGVTIHKHD